MTSVSMLGLIYFQDYVKRTFGLDIAENMKGKVSGVIVTTKGKIAAAAAYRVVHGNEASTTESGAFGVE